MAQKYHQKYYSLRVSRIAEQDVAKHGVHAGASKRTVSTSQLLTSTWEHRVITGGSVSLMALLLCKGVTEIHSPIEALSGLGAAMFAYYLSGQCSRLVEESSTKLLP